MPNWDVELRVQGAVSVTVEADTEAEAYEAAPGADWFSGDIDVIDVQVGDVTEASA